MGGHRRPVRGGKLSFKARNEQKKFQKKKREKFDLHTCSYIKDRKYRNEEIENRRKRLEEEKQRKRLREEDSSEEEEEAQNPLDELLSTFDNSKKGNVAIESEDEETEDESEGENETVVEKEGEDEEEEEINIKIDEDEDDAETAKEDDGELLDTFSIHLRNDLDDDLYNVISNPPVNYKTEKLSWPTLGNVMYMIPQKKNKEIDEPSAKKKKVTILQDTEYAKQGTVPSVLKKVNLEKLHIKTQIRENIISANERNICSQEQVTTKTSPLTDLQKEIFTIVNNYQDLLYTERTFSNADEIRFVYCLHAINHVLKTRTKILHHNAKLQKSKNDIALVPEEYRDQGLIRPKVLIILPLKYSCLLVVQTLISILIGEDKGGSVMNKIRFMEEFSEPERTVPKRNPKPDDYEMTFKGNIDDEFRIGLSITKKTLKLYTNFYSSDIIIASPVGLLRLIGAEEESEKDYDFLASIELLILDQVDLLMMQNWDFLINVLEHLHLQPKKSHDTDFSRVRSWAVNGWTKYYRQSLIFSGRAFPEILSFFNKHCLNYAGKAKISNPVLQGSVQQVIVQLPLVFHRMEVSNHLQLTDERLKFFCSNILPQYRDSIMYHTLIYVPSFCDYVVLRNYMRKEEMNFVQICEYSKDNKVARARDKFFHSDAHFMLYSERGHYFHRRLIKGIRHLIFYAPPTIPHFFSEMCNLMQESNQNFRAGSEANMTVTTIYSKYDILHLSAIVGTERASRMLTSEKDVHMLMTK